MSVVPSPEFGHARPSSAVHVPPGEACGPERPWPRGDRCRLLSDPRSAAQLADTPRPEQIDADAYDAVLVAGGHGAMWDFPDNPGPARIAGTVYERGGVVSAVCHGPAALVGVTLSEGSYLVAGRKVAAFPNTEESAVSPAWRWCRRGSIPRSSACWGWPP